jgi:hypothetical protein
MPPTWTKLVFRNPEPVMAKVSALVPAGTLLGLMDVMAGVAVVLPPPLPELEPLPPHPLRTPRIPSAKTKVEKRAKRNNNLQNPGNLTEGAYLSITDG